MTQIDCTKQIARYTALAKRYSEIVLASGGSWKPEYTEELKGLTRELTALRKEIDEHYRKSR